MCEPSGFRSIARKYELTPAQEQMLRAELSSDSGVPESAGRSATVNTSRKGTGSLPDHQTPFDPYVESDTNPTNLV